MRTMAVGLVEHAIARRARLFYLSKSIDAGKICACALDEWVVLLCSTFGDFILEGCLYMK